MKLFKIIFIFLLILINACGGGSSGTGTEFREQTITIEGNVKNTSGQAIVNALLTIVETGDSATSDQNGDFVLETNTNEDNLNLKLESENINSNIELNNIQSKEGSTIQLDIEIDSQLKEVNKKDLEVQAKIVGECDQYFDNFRTIRQSNPTPTNGIQCTARVVVKNAGNPLGNAPVRIQHRACQTGSNWIDDALGLTRDETDSKGVAQVNFSFKNNREHCVYRIIAPSDVPDLRPIIHFVDTFTKQRFDERGLN